MKRNDNKGFTLIELLATIVLLATISLIAVVSVINIINKGKENDCKSLKNSIEMATKEYVSDKRYTYSNKNDKYLTVLDLVNGNYLKGNIVNPFTKKDIAPNSIELIVKLNDDYTVNEITIDSSEVNFDTCKNS